MARAETWFQVTAGRRLGESVELTDWGSPVGVPLRGSNYRSVFEVCPNQTSRQFAP